MTSLDHLGQRTVDAYGGPCFDACVFHEWPGTGALAPYLSEGWHEALIRPGDKSGPVRGMSQWLYQDPSGPKLTSAYPSSGPAGSQRELLVEQVLRDRRLDRVVLGYDDGLLATAYVHHYIAHTIARAANDWTIAEWLDRDERLYGLVLVANVLPEHAAEEIRRAGAHPKMVAIAMGANGLGRPFGHPIYHPIYAAAEEMGLPLVIQVGSESAGDSVVPPVSGGMPATFGEYRALSMHGHMTHLASLIVQGVFEIFPSLKVLFVGGGVAWIPGYLWRLDSLYKTGSNEVPWLRHLPSEYFPEHCRVSTYSLEEPADPSRLIAVLETISGFDKLLMYASCYPNSDSQTMSQLAPLLPESWYPSVFTENAEDFFRWPSGAPPNGLPSNGRS